MTQADLKERLGKVVGSKYQVLHRLGGGGMSQVFLARHRFHGGLFAIKVLAEHLATDRSLVSRFEREARMTASLANHPNIVSIFDIAKGSGIYYLVMQFVAGEDLGNYLHRAGRLSLVDAANVIAQATEALSCAESRRIVHRDLKPGNMLLDETGRVKLLDFGISRIVDLSDGLTRAGEAVGTPYYMSPEQIRGEACDIRSDLYSLGVVFFELLTGRRPFENVSASAIQIAHLNAPPPSLLAYDPQLPAACDAIVQKLIAKLPGERFQNTADLLKVLTANGANPTPGTLRPTIDAGVQEAIARAQAMPLENAILSSTGSVSSPVVPRETRATAAETLPPTRSTPSPAAPPSTTPAPAESPAPVQPRKSKLGLMLAVSAAVVLILALAVGYFVFSRPKPSTDRINTITQTHQSTEAIAPSPVSSHEPTKNVASLASRNLDSGDPSAVSCQCLDTPLERPSNPVSSRLRWSPISNLATMPPSAKPAN